MKKLKKIVTLLLAAALMLTPLMSNVMTANAEEPVTYYVKYVEDIKEWRFQTGEWKDDGYHRELYYLEQDIKDGDVLVVEGNTSTLNLKVNVRLSNLTYKQANANVTAKSVDNCYVIFNSYCATNGDVTNAYVYDSSVCNFNNNVTNLEVISTVSGLTASIAVVGTVEHLKGYDSEKVYYDFYNFTTNTLAMEGGTLKTNAANYSTTAPAASTTAPATTTTGTASGTTASSGEYDDVPKTGEWNPAWMLLAVAAVCGAMSKKLRTN